MKRSITVVAALCLLSISACKTTTASRPANTIEPTQQNNQPSLEARLPKTEPTIPSPKPAAEAVIVTEGKTKGMTASAVEQIIITFPYDSAALDNKDQRTLEKIANYLNRHPNTNLTVEGHADERGSTAYNLALGEERADRVRKALKIYGVDGSRVNVLSYGEEQPLIDRDTPRAYRLNRRVEFDVRINEYSQK